MLPPEPVFDDDEEQQAGPADEVLSGRVFTPECEQIVYEYDFGDSWEHVVKLVKRTPGGDQDDVPKCLAGENATPLDDSGGIYGHYRYLEALADPADEVHDEAKAWLGAKYDPARFDLAAANKRLTAAFKPVREAAAQAPADEEAVKARSDGAGRCVVGRRESASPADFGFGRRKAHHAAAGTRGGSPISGTPLDRPAS